MGRVMGHHGAVTGSTVLTPLTAGQAVGLPPLNQFNASRSDAGASGGASWDIGHGFVTKHVTCGFRQDNHQPLLSRPRCRWPKRQSPQA